MRRLVAVEALKLSTTRGPVLLLVLAVALAVIGVAGLPANGPVEDSPIVVRDLLSHAGFTSFLTLILGIGAYATEYRHGTIAYTYLATPRRRNVLIAKQAAYGVAGLAFGLVSAATALATTAALAAAEGVSLDLTGADATATLAGAVGWNVLFALIGVGVGALVPSYAGAVAGTLVWIALVEGLVAELVEDVERWLPMASGLALANAPRPDLAEQWTGALVLSAYAIVTAAAAAVVVDRRDVT
jgi:ABC-2 type transport system permease protein